LKKYQEVNNLSLKKIGWQTKIGDIGLRMVKSRKREKRQQQHQEVQQSKTRTQKKPEVSEKDYKGIQ